MPLPPSKEKCFLNKWYKSYFQTKLNTEINAILLYAYFSHVFASHLKYRIICLFGTIACATLFLISHVSRVLIANSNLVLQVPF